MVTYLYSEAHYGALPSLNEELKRSGKTKQHKNLLAVTLGTGFGAGIVDDDACYSVTMLVAPNMAITLLLQRNAHCEDLVGSIAIQRIYKELRSKRRDPFEIYQIAKKQREGNIEAALESFRIMGGAIGEALANALTLIDSPIVIGGGLSNAIDLFGPQMMKVMRRPYKTKSGKSLSRLCEPLSITDENEKGIFRT